MNVKELIQELQKIKNQKTKIVVISNNFELQGAEIEATHLRKFKGKIIEQNFMDASDYTRYSKEIVQDTEQETDEEFVQIS